MIDVHFSLFFFFFFAFLIFGDRISLCSFGCPGLKLIGIGLPLLSAGIKSSVHNHSKFEKWFFNWVWDQDKILAFDLRKHGSHAQLGHGTDQCSVQINCVKWFRRDMFSVTHTGIQQKVFLGFCHFILWPIAVIDLSETETGFFDSMELTVE